MESTASSQMKLWSTIRNYYIWTTSKKLVNRNLNKTVNEMKQELTWVREELKALEKEKCLIINKINSIKHQYKEAKESVQNAEEVLTYTNRAIHNTNYNNSLRASMVSSSSKYLKAQESRVNTESNQRLNTENSVSNFKNSLNKDTMNFYNLTINKNEDANIEEADNVSKEIWSR